MKLRSGSLLPAAFVALDACLTLACGDAVAPSAETEPGVNGAGGAEAGTAQASGGRGGSAGAGEGGAAGASQPYVEGGAAGEGGSNGGGGSASAGGSGGNGGNGTGGSGPLGSSFQGSIDCQTNACLQELCASYAAINGSVRVSGAEIVDLSALSCLTYIGGQLEIAEAPKLVSVRLPALEFIGADLSVHHVPALALIDLPKLDRIVGSLELHHANALGSVKLGALARAKRFVVDLPALAELDLPLLAKIDDRFELPTPSSLVSFALPAFVSSKNAFVVQKQPKLTTIALPKLASVGSRLALDENASLGAISLPSLETVGDAILLSGNEALASFSAPKLVSANALFASSNPNLATVELGALKSLGFGLQSIALPKLTALALPSLETTGMLAVEGAMLASVTAPKLATIQASGAPHGLKLYSGAPSCVLDLPLLGRIAGDVAIEGAGFAALAFPALTSVTGTFGMQKTRSTTLELPLLVDAKLIDLRANAQLGSLSFPALLAGGFRLQENPVLTTVAWPALTTLRDLVLFGLPALGSLDLGAITTATGYLTVDGVGLQTFALPSLLLVGPSVQVANNPNLESVSMPLATSGGELNLSLSKNPKLTTLSFSKLTNVSYLSIVDDDALVELTGFPSLVSVPKRLLVRDNGALLSVTPLYALDAIGELTITGNPSLPAANASGLVSAVGAGNIQGPTKIADNGP